MYIYIYIYNYIYTYCIYIYIERDLLHQRKLFKIFSTKDAGLDTTNLAW